MHTHTLVAREPLFTCSCGRHWYFCYSRRTVRWPISLRQVTTIAAASHGQIADLITTPPSANDEWRPNHDDRCDCEAAAVATRALLITQSARPIKGLRRLLLLLADHLRLFGGASRHLWRVDGVGRRSHCIRTRIGVQKSRKLWCCCSSC